MGERGPKPAPARLHLIRGNPGKRSMSSLLDEAIRPPVEIPDVPEFLEGEALAEWDRITPHLHRLGLISAIDRGALIGYCLAWGRLAKAEKMLSALGDDGMIDQTPSGYRQIGVWLQIAHRAAEQMKSFLSEFGMSPSARSRVTVSDSQLELPGVEKPTEGGWGSYK